MEFDWVGFDRIGLDWIGLDWIGLDSTGLYWTILYGGLQKMVAIGGAYVGFRLPCRASGRCACLCLAVHGSGRNRLGQSRVSKKKRSHIAVGAAR